MTVAETVDLTAAKWYCVIPLWYLRMEYGADSRTASAWLREHGGAPALPGARGVYRWTYNDHDMELTTAVVALAIAAPQTISRHRMDCAPPGDAIVEIAGLPCQDAPTAIRSAASAA